MPGTLHVVATPIGNLEDVTLRALSVLRSSALIAAEDTRRTAKLLTRHGISTPTLSYHEHNRRSRLPHILRRLQAGDDVALVSDAGTPGISDPGAELVQACVEADIPINPVPGVSAPLAAAIASGFPLVPFSIYGFAPSRAKDRFAWLERLADVPHTLCFFESPSRIVDSLGDATRILGERPIVVGRELTKAHQEFLRGSSAEVLSQLRTTKGEFTIVVGPVISKDSSELCATDDDLVAEFGVLTNSGGASRREAISTLAKRYKRPARHVYQIIERAKPAV